MKKGSLIILFCVLAFIFQSCGITAKFPVSSIVPAADITATKSVDKNKNYVIKVTAKSLAHPERLNPPKKTYVIWAISNEGNIINIGQLVVSKNARKTKVFKTSISNNPSQLFITAEDQGNISSPLGTEITRASFKK